MDGDGCGDGGWGGGGGGWGWFFPAMIVGRVIAEAFDQKPAAPAPVAQPLAAAAPARFACHHCRHSVAAGSAFCPHCGGALTATPCRYCGQQLPPEMRYCAHCGAPRPKAAAA